MTRSGTIRRATNRRRRRDARRTWRALLALAAVVGGSVVLVWITRDVVRRRDGAVGYGDLPGIDIAGLTPASREALLVKSNRERCPCGCPYTLAACLHQDPTCPQSGPILENWVDSLAEAESEMYADDPHDEQTVR